VGDRKKLSRRERQIIEVLYARGAASVAEVAAALADSPTPQAVRRLLEILVEKGHARRNDGRPVAYRPAQSRRKAGAQALRGVLDTFFGGALDEALSVHLESPRTQLTDEQLARIISLIEEAQKQDK
jgi:predicted transcriptional regulator